MTCVVDMASATGDRAGHSLLCTRCGGRKPLPLPLAISQMTLLIREFQREHALCKPRHPLYADVHQQ